MRKSALIFTTFLLPVFTAKAALCPNNGIDVPATTPSSQFQVVDDNDNPDPSGQLVIDLKTGLMWDRCQWGYVWSSVLNKCEIDPAHTGDYLMSWDAALDVVKYEITDTNLHLGKSDWRLPNIKELSSIIERKCISPAINDEIFAGTEAAPFWSNTHVRGSISHAIRVVQFAGGGVGSDLIDKQYRLRLVRDMP